MPWVCSFCSTNNEDENELCFVCDAPRPVAPPPSPAPAATTGVCTLTKTRVRSLGLSGNVVVPEEFNAIGESAFAGRRDITSVTLHGGVKKIGPSAFSGCHSLTRISGGEGLTSIGARAFYDCPALGGPRPHARYMADDAFGMPVSRPAPTPPPPRVTPAPPPPPPRVTPTPRPSPRVTTTATSTPRPSATSDTAANIGIAILFLVLCAAVVFLVLSLVRFVNADPLPGCLWLGASLTLTLLLANIAVYGNTGESSLVPHIAALPVVALNLLLFGTIGAGYTLIGAIVFGAYLPLSLSLFIFAICDYFRSDRLYVKERLLHGTAAALSVFLFVLSVL